MTFPDRFGRPASYAPDTRVPLVYAAVAATVLVAAFAAVQQPKGVLVAVVALSAVTVVLIRTDLAILLVVASAPVELAVTTTIGGLSLTKIAGGLCFISFALYALRSRRRDLLRPEPGSRAGDPRRRDAFHASGPRTE